MGATTHAVDSSHVAMLSHPSLVIDVIRATAKSRSRVIRYGVRRVAAITFDSKPNPSGRVRSHDAIELNAAIMKTNRCAWASADNPLMLEYHDREWGVPVHDDRTHFEFLVLSGAQAGLNFLIVLKKREGYRRAFDKFDPEKVAHYSEGGIQKLTSDLEIIRNRMKIEAAVRNARAFLKTQEEFGDFNSYCWRFVGGRPKLNRWKATGQIPATSPESDAFSKDLKQRGFSLVGSTVVYPYMQSVGMVNDHLVDCFRYREIKQLCRTQIEKRKGNARKEEANASGWAT